MRAFLVLLTVTVASAQWAVPAWNSWNSWAHPQHLGYSSVVAAAPHQVVAAAPAAVVAHTPVIAGATKTQYHSQDELGQAAWGHSQAGQAHAAVRDAAGGVSGTFSYISPEGIPFTTHYRADHNGYRVASNALPVAPGASIVGPVDTPEVQAAKVAHANAHILARGKRQVAVVGSVAHTPANTVLTPTYVHHQYAAVAAAPVFRSAVVHAAAPAVHAVAPVVHHAVAPVHHYASPLVRSAAVVAAPAVVHHAAPVSRVATLTRVINTPGHAVSYRVD